MGSIDLILNVGFVILPLLIFQSFWENKEHALTERKGMLTMGILSSFSIILCMMLPFRVLPGYIFDLRTIPLIIGILYGGNWGGAMAALTLYIVRFYLGGEGVWNVLIVYTFIIVLVFLLVPYYQEASSSRKKWMVAGISMLTSILMLLNTAFRTDLPEDQTLSFVLYLIVHGLAAWASVYLIEKWPFKNSPQWNEGHRPISNKSRADRPSSI